MTIRAYRFQMVWTRTSNHVKTAKSLSQCRFCVSIVCSLLVNLIWHNNVRKFTIKIKCHHDLGFEINSKQIDLQANDAFYEATWNGSCMRNRIRQFHPCWISNGAYACTWIGCVSTACDKSPFHSIDCLAPVGCLSHSDFCNCRVCVCL